MINLDYCKDERDYLSGCFMFCLIVYYFLGCMYVEHARCVAGHSQVRDVVPLIAIFALFDCQDRHAFNGE